MLTRARFQEACPDNDLGQPREKPEIKKGCVVLVEGVKKIIMARLQADSENPITFSICDSDLRNPLFGVKLDGVGIVSPESLSPELRARAKCFA